MVQGADGGGQPEEKEKKIHENLPVCGEKALGRTYTPRAVFFQDSCLSRRLLVHGTLSWFFHRADLAAILSVRKKRVR
jgi:hypothetical protein